MTAADRRMEIVSILVVSGHITSRELAGNFFMDRYKPYDNTLISYEQENSKKCMMQRVRR